MRLFLLVFITFFSNYAIAQVATQNKAEKVATAPPKKKVLTTSRDRFSINMNIDNFHNKPDSIKVKWYSRGFEMYLMYDRQLGKSRFSVAPGVGIGINNYYTNSIVVKDSTNKTILSEIPTGLSYKRNKMNIVYADVPIELRYRSKPDLNGNSIKVAVGVRLGYLLNSHVKYRGTDYTALDRGTITEKLITIQNLSTLRYGLTARVGYSVVSLQFYYGLNPLFQLNRGPAMYPFSVGISFNGF